MCHLENEAVGNEDDESMLNSCEVQSFRGNEYMLYTRRWLMLAMFTIPCIVNGMLFLSMAAITEVTEERFDVSAELVNALGQGFYTVFLLSLPMGMIVLGRKNGLREATLVAGLLNTIGSGFRIPSTLVSRHAGFALLITGNIVAAASQPYFLVVPPLISSKWFGDEEQGVATAIAALGNQVGLALGFFLARFLVDLDNYDTVMFRMNCCVFASVFMNTCLVYFVFEDHPPSPPGYRVAHTRAFFGFWQSAKQIWAQTKKHATCYFVFIGVSFGSTAAVYWNLGLLLDGTMANRFSSTEVAVSGCCLMSAGIPGMYFAGILMDYLHMEFKYTVSITLALSWVSLTALTLVLAQPSDLQDIGLRVDDAWKPSALFVFSTCSAVGVFLGALQPMFLQMGAHITYPLSEEVSSSLLFLCGSQIAFVLVFVSNGFTSALPMAQGSFYRNISFAGLVLLVALGFVFTKVAISRERSTTCPEADQSTANPLAVYGSFTGTPVSDH
ncbi:putative feline leukemia virus subgroup C receptor-related protein 2-like isoform X1 [Diplonema papillatum]|nr:putative feline leukemia virus subgroup C receptor-related protein 2-like isoform X1 [Diplonema papillatum]